MSTTSQEKAILRQGDYEIPLLSYDFNSDHSIIDLEFDLPENDELNLFHMTDLPPIYIIFPQSKKRYQCFYSINLKPYLHTLDRIRIQLWFGVKEVLWQEDKESTT
ncbi:MAG: hypothetical protein V3U54_13180 [Thermodesulfobacteriota bacterium]